MSHITEVAVAGVAGEVDVVDLDAFASAVGQLGGTFLRDQRTYACYPGGWVGDTKPPEWWDRSMWERCDHAAAFPDCEYEVGLVKVGGAYKVVMDYWHGGGLSKRLGGDSAPTLMKAYAEHRNATLAEEALLAEAARQGLAARVEQASPGVRKVVVSF